MGENYKVKFWIASDTETTGFDPETNSLVEIATVDQNGDWACSLIKPTTPIGFGAMATHHITPQMVENELDLESVLYNIALDEAQLSALEIPVGPEEFADAEPILVFHNAAFDRSFLPAHLNALRFVCTWRCALALLPNMESYSNGALWYELGLDHVMPEEAGRMPHRALFDAIMTADIMKWLLDMLARDHPNIADPLEHLIWLTAQPILLKKVAFGKHRDSLWSDVPSDYLAWCLRQDFDEDVKYTCRYWTEEHRRG